MQDQEEKLSKATDADRFPRAALPIGLGMIVAGGVAGNLVSRQVINENNNQEKSPITHTNTSGHAVGELPDSHVSKLVKTPSHEEVEAIMAHARHNKAPVHGVGPDGPMIEHFDGHPVYEVGTAVAVKKQGDKIVTIEAP